MNSSSNVKSWDFAYTMRFLQEGEQLAKRRCDLCRIGSDLSMNVFRCTQQEVGHVTDRSSLIHHEWEGFDVQMYLPGLSDENEMSC